MFESIYHFQFPKFFPEGVEIEECLCRMLMCAVTSIDDVRFADAAEKVRSSGGGMSNYHHVDLHRLDVASCIFKGLSLGNAAAGDREVHNIRRESTFGELEGDSRSRRAFEEQVDDRDALKTRHLLDWPLEDLSKRSRCIQDRLDVLSRQTVHSKQMSIR